MPKIIHYRNKCIGCGVCHQMQPGYWRMSKKDGKAVLVNGVNKNEIYVLAISRNIQMVAEATAVACPSRIIKVFV